MKKEYGWEKPALLKRLGITPRTPGTTRIRPATEQERQDHEANMKAQRQSDPHPGAKGK
jgi:hypothetical protein